MPAVVVRQRKAWRRRDGVFLYFEVRTLSRTSRYTSPLIMSSCKGQRRCDRKPQGRNEGLRNHGSRRERMCESMIGSAHYLLFLIVS